uniref:Retrovirus-related Pol polyprotein from transposon TNT 1-94 n=1 Tax=Nicotiana tabacum TaxID=4097 RepID=A0A1S4BRA2_TOBAC|nr:PREDICTED: uncharacterized protein LOC107811077 [Nicotiana tabacum]
MAEDSELWDVICDCPYIPTKNVRDLPLTMPKTKKEYTDADKKAVEKNFRAKKILEIWEALQTAYEGTTQAKQSKIDMLTTEYELFRMNDDESIQDMHTRFISIINELHSLGEIIRKNKLVRKILSILPSSWESKVNVITEAKDLQELTIDELDGNLKTYEMKRKIDSERREPKTKKNLVLKAKSNDSSEEDSGMTYLTKRFQKMVRRNGGILKKGNSSRPKNYDLCHKCGKPGYFIKDCPLMKHKHSKYNPDKTAKRNPVPDKHFKRKRSADNVKLMSLASVLIDAYHSPVEDKDALTLELEEAEQTRDDLVVCVVDLKETISNLEDEKMVLTEKIASIEQERDDLVVVVVTYKETIENFSKEKETLVKRVTEIEEEGDDLLIVIADRRETIEGLGTESRPGNSEKGKEVANEAHIRLENELKAVKTRFGDLSFLKAIDDDAELWHKRLGHASFSLLNKLIQKEPVHVLPMSKFKEHKVYDASARGKHVKSSFKSKKDVSTSKPLDLLHMDMCGPMRVQSRGGKRYIFAIVHDYSRFTWTLCLRTKDETFEVFMAFVKKIQVKMESRVACIILDHGTRFDNAKFDEFYNENGITLNFSVLRTPQQNGVVEKKNRTLEEMARTMLMTVGLQRASGLKLSTLPATW